MKKEPKELEQPRLLEIALAQITEHCQTHEGRYLKALEESEKKQVTLTFSCAFNLGDVAPIVDTKMSFRDKCRESGMDVVKTFTAKLTHKEDDPSMPFLPGADPKENEAGNGEPASDAPRARGRGKPKAEGRKKSAKKDKANEPAGEPATTAAE